MLIYAYVCAHERNALSAPDIRTDSPERCTHKETDVLAQLQELSVESELFHDGIENQARDDLGIVGW